MKTYEYTLDHLCCLCCIHEGVSNSDMSDKSLLYCNWDKDEELLSTIFENELSVEDEIKLDIIVEHEHEEGICNCHAYATILDSNGIIIPSKCSYLFDDFNQESLSSANYWDTTTSGGYVDMDYSKVDNSHPGIVRLVLSNTINYYTGIRLSNVKTGLKIANGVITFETVLKITQINNNFSACYGMGDTPSGSTLEHPNGVYFLVDLNSLYWQIVTSSGGIPTKTITDILIAENSWIKLKFIINSLGTSVEFFINDNSKGLHTTNIPTSSILLDQSYKMKALDNGSSSRATYIDYHFHKIIFTNER